MIEQDNIGASTADEILAAAQGADQEEIEALRLAKEKGEGDKGDEGDEGDEGAGTGGDEGDEGAGDKGDEGDEGTELSEEDYNTVSEELKGTLEKFTDDASEETKAIKKEMLSLFEKGVSFDEEGNILDKEGEQVASFKDLVNKVGAEDEAIFDETGNQVDKEGKIITSKFDLDIADSEINILSKELGYNFKTEDGKEKLYKQGNEGLKDLTNDISLYDTEKFKQEFFNSNPLLREVAKHLLGGGTLEDFQKPVDFTKVETDKLTVSNKINYVKQAYLSEGVAELRAEKLTKDLKEGDDLDKEVTEALEVLQSKQNENAQRREDALERQSDADARANNNYWEEVEGVVTKGKLDNFTIPEVDREAFFTYLSAPIKDGRSQDMIDKQESKLPTKLKEAYYRFKKYDVSNIVKEGVSTRNVQTIRQRMKQNEELSKGHKPNINKGSTEEISLETII